MINFAALLIGLFALVLGDGFHNTEDENFPRFLTGAVGDFVVFNCDIDFPQDYPIPYKLFWKKGDEDIFVWQNGFSSESQNYSGRIELVDKSPANHQYISFIEKNKRRFGRASINLTSIRESDAGWYECKVMFPTRTPPFRNNGSWFHLTVSGGNLLAIPPINQTVLEDQPVKFMCIVKDIPSIRIRWLKDGLPLSDYHDLFRRSLVGNDGSLEISAANIMDFGEYECEASNKAGDVQKAKAYLNVQYKAKVIYAPAEIFLAYGKPAIIDCNYRANPPLKNLRWEKDGFLYDPYNIQGVFYRKNGSLYINKVEDIHSGIYTCTPYNDLGTQGPSSGMYVIVQKSPIFTKTPNPVYFKKLGETVELPCDAHDGHNGHRPVIVWHKKDAALPFNRHETNDGNLTIRNIQENDHGIYQCSAANKAAVVTVETELLVENVPSSAPYNLTATVLSPTTVHLTWLSRREFNVEFVVWYKKIEELEWKIYNVPKTRNLEATIHNLEPETEYDFMVLCKDDHDNSRKSMKIWTKPKERHDRQGPVGISFPRFVEIKPTDEGLFVKWDPPAFGMELFKTYIVRWNKASDELIIGTVQTPETNYLIRNLLEGTEYDIDIVAVSVDDQQAVSEKVRALYPGFKSIRAVATGIIGGLAFLGVIFVAVYFIRKRFFQKRSQLLKK